MSPSSGARARPAAAPTDTSEPPDTSDDSPADSTRTVGVTEPEAVDEWAELFQALADTNRLRLLLAIHHTPGINVTDLAQTVGMGANATSHALAALRLRGVVRSERVGRERRWIIASDPIHQLLHQVGATHSPLHPEH